MKTCGIVDSGDSARAHLVPVQCRLGADAGLVVGTPLE